MLVASPMPRPKIFVSYSHDTKEHSERVLGLAERLRTDGFDTMIDRYVEGTPPQGWPRWTSLSSTGPITFSFFAPSRYLPTLPGTRVSRRGPRRRLGRGDDHQRAL